MLVLLPQCRLHLITGPLSMTSLLVRMFSQKLILLFADSSPAPVDLGPCQTQTDPSVHSPCVDFGSGGEAQEPVQVGSATSSFLASLRAAGIVVPQGVVIGDRLDRASSPATVHGAPAVAAQHEQPQEPLGGGRTMRAASAHPAPELEVQDGQTQSILRSDRASSAQAGFAGPSLGASPHEVAFREVTFAEPVREFAEEDAASSSSEKVAVSEGYRMFSGFCISSAPVRPLNFLLHLARCAILRGFLLRRIPLPS